jgi:hypothetical protein
MRNYDIQFMPKPFSPLKLTQTVEDLLAGRDDAATSDTQH